MKTVKNAQPGDDLIERVERLETRVDTLEAEAAKADVDKLASLLLASAMEDAKQ